MSQISVLFRLQQIDSQIDSINNTLQGIDKELSDNSLVISAQQKLEQADQLHKSELIKLHASENKSYATRVKIELAESSLYAGKVQNPKELQDIQNEIASLKRLIVSLEDKELEAMMAAEDAEIRLTQANKDLEDIQVKRIEHDAALNGEKTKFINQLERLFAERDVTAAPITPADLSLYDQLRKSRNGVAVVKITSRACMACGTTLTPALVQSIQSSGQLVRCPNCGRILYPG
jgi:uncharacterized protein